jgi:hypothetical protein
VGGRRDFASAYPLRHCQIAGKSRVGNSTASAPKGLAVGTTGKLVGMVRTCCLGLSAAKPVTASLDQSTSSKWRAGRLKGRMGAVQRLDGSGLGSNPA